MTLPTIDEALTILVPTYRNDGRARRVLAGLAALVAGSEGRMRLIFGDNSQLQEKQDFLHGLAAWSPDLIEVQCRPIRISGQKNILDLYQRSRSDFLMFHADDDYMSDDFMVRAHEALLQDRAIAASYTTYIVSRRDAGLIAVPSQPPQLDQVNPVERLMENHRCWGGFNLLFYSVFRKQSIAGCAAFLKACPIEAPFHDWWFTHEMVCKGAIHNAGVGSILYAADGMHERGGSDSIRHYGALGLPPLISHLQLLFTAAEGACFFLGKYSPWPDAVRRQACAQFLFEMNTNVAIANFRQTGLDALSIEGEIGYQLTERFLSDGHITLDLTIDFLHFALAQTDVDLADRYREFLRDAAQPAF